MCTTFDGVDVIYIGVYILGEAGVVLHRHLNRHPITLRIDINNVLNQRFATLVQELHKAFQTILRIEFVMTVIALLILFAFVSQV